MSVKVKIFYSERELTQSTKILVLLLLKPATEAQKEKNKIVYKLLTQHDKHLHHEKLKSKVREPTND